MNRKKKKKRLQAYHTQGKYRMATTCCIILPWDLDKMVNAGKQGIHWLGQWLCSFLRSQWDISFDLRDEELIYLGDCKQLRFSWVMWNITKLLDFWHKKHCGLQTKKELRKWTSWGVSYIPISLLLCKCMQFIAELGLNFTHILKVFSLWHKSKIETSTNGWESQIPTPTYI